MSTDHVYNDSSERELALDAAAAFCTRDFERAAHLLRTLNEQTHGRHLAVKRNLAVAEWHIARSTVASTTDQSDTDRGTTPEDDYDRAVACYHAGRPSDALQFLTAWLDRLNTLPLPLAQRMVLLSIDLCIARDDVGRAAVLARQLDVWLAELASQQSPFDSTDDPFAAPTVSATDHERQRLLFYRARVQAARGDMNAAGRTLVQLPLPSESTVEADTSRVMLAGCFLRAQVLTALRQPVIAHDLLDMLGQLDGGHSAVDLLARGCILAMQEKWALAALAFDNAALAVQDTRALVQIQPLRVALAINTTLLHLCMGETVRAADAAQQEVARLLDAASHVPAVLWLLLAQSIIAMHTDSSSVGTTETENCPVVPLARVVQQLTGQTDANYSAGQPLTTSWSLDLAISCLCRYLLTLTEETNESGQAEPCNGINSGDNVTHIIDQLDQVSSTYRLAYAYGLLAWIWCLLLQPQREEDGEGQGEEATPSYDVILVNRLIGALLTKDEAWLAAAASVEHSLAAQRVTFLARVYYAAILLRTQEWSSARAVLASQPPFLANAADFQNTQQEPTPPRPFQPDLFADTRLRSKQRWARQQCIALTVVDSGIGQTVAIDSAAQRMAVSSAQHSLSVYTELDRQRTAMDARPVGTHGIDERLQTSMRELTQCLLQLQPQV